MFKFESLEQNYYKLPNADLPAKHAKNAKENYF